MPTLHSIVLSLSLLLLCFGSGALAQESLGPAPPVPEGIRLTPPSAELEQEMAGRLTRVLDSAYSGSDTLVKGSLLVVDPVLWDALKERPEVSGAEQIKVQAILPRAIGTLTGEGRAFRHAPSVKLVEGMLRERLAGDGKLSVRRVTPAELDYVWALISFDIDGPLLTVESPKRRLVFLLDASDKMLQVFELPARELTVDEALELIGALPLTEHEESPMKDVLDHPELPLPGVVDADDIALLVLIDEAMLAARVDKDRLTQYADQVDGLIAAAVPAGAGRVLVQSSFDADGKVTIAVRAPAQAGTGLKASLEALPAPPSKGPVTIVLVKDR